MFQFPGFAHALQRVSRLHRDGLPHSDICGSRPIADPRSFSQLITSFFASESLDILHAPFITSFDSHLCAREIVYSLLYYFTMSMNSCANFYPIKPDKTALLSPE